MTEICDKCKGKTTRKCVVCERNLCMYCRKVFVLREEKTGFNRITLELQRYSYLQEEDIKSMNKFPTICEDCWNKIHKNLVKNRQNFAKPILEMLIKLTVASKL